MKLLIRIVRWLVALATWLVLRLPAFGDAFANTAWYLPPAK